TSPMPVCPALSVRISRLRVKYGPCAPERLSSMPSRPATGTARSDFTTGVSAIRSDLLQVAQQLADERREVGHLHALEPLGGEDRAQPRETLVEIAVDQDVVVLLPVQDLLDGVL